MQAGSGQVDRTEESGVVPGAPLAPIKGLRLPSPPPGGAGAGRLAWKLEGSGGSELRMLHGKILGVLGVCGTSG